MIRQGKLDEAKKMLVKIISIDPNNAGSYHNLGILALFRNRINEAMSYFRKALGINGNMATSYDALGVCNILRNNQKQAIKFFKIALEIDKDNANILKNLATTYSSNGEYDKCIELMEHYLSGYAMDLNARNILANAYFRNKKYDKCLWNLQYIRQNLGKSSSHTIDQAMIYNNIGVAHIYLKNFTYAIDALNKSINLRNEQYMAIPYMNLVNVYLLQNKIDDAENLIKKYLDSDPRDFLPVNVLSEHYYNTNNYLRAQELANLVLERKKDDVAALSSLSSIYNEVIKNNDKALELAKRAYEADTSNRISLNNLAYTYLTMGRVQEARDLLNKVKLHRAYFALYATKGLLRILEGNIDEGTKLYDEAEELAPSIEWKQLVKQKKHLEIGKYYVSKGEIEKAKLELSKIMSQKSIGHVYSDC